MSADIVTALEILRCLHSKHSELNISLRQRIHMPDKKGILRSVNNVYFEDIPYVSAPPGYFPAHQSIAIDMARAFGVSFLSTFSIQDEDSDDEDMAEDLTDRIRGVLNQYNSEQIFNEFLANAEDAGAKSFAVTLDERQSLHTERLLTPSMAPLQNEALLFWNDAVFRKEDFRGIRRVGLGGKIDTPNTIGKFGLGSLSMFHFTEVGGKHALVVLISDTHNPTIGRYYRFCRICSISGSLKTTHYAAAM